MMDLGVEGMMVSPGYSYSKAPDQEHFLRAQRAHDLFRRILSKPKRRWRFNQSPLFLQFLMGKRDYECTPWGNPTFNVFGWQRPCYLLQEGYAAQLPGPARRHPLGALREAERQREVPRLHGPLRVRADRRPGDLRHLARASGTRWWPPCPAGVRDWQAEKTLEGWAPEPDAETALARIVELAFDYRGNTTVVRDGRRSARGLRVQPRCGRSRRRSSRCSTPTGGGPITVRYAEMRDDPLHRQGHRGRQVLRRMARAGSRRRRPDGRPARGAVTAGSSSRARALDNASSSSSAVAMEAAGCSGGCPPGHPAAPDRADRGPRRDPPRPSRCPFGLSGARGLCW